MPLAAAKCTNCGAALQVDSTKDAAICRYCGMPFIVEKAVNYYNTTNHITAGVVNIFGGNSADFVIRAGTLVKYNGASTEVTIPNTVRVIGRDAFQNCAALTSVALPSGLEKIEDRAFYGCESLTEVLIPEGVRKIADAAFSGCKRLEKVILPSSLESIERFAFYACESLTEILIPEKVREIGTDAFGKCDRLKTIRLHCDQIVFDEHGVGDPFGYKSNVTEVYASQALIRRIIDFDLRHSSAESFCGFLMDSVWFRTLKEENQRRQIAQWKASGRCQYCGGKLKGLFTRRCLSCGREQ